MILKELKHPHEIKGLSNEELDALAIEIRDGFAECL